MTPYLLTTGFLIIAVLSALHYDVKSKNYGGGRAPLSSVKSFRWIHRLVQASTILVTVSSLHVTHPTLLRLYDSPFLSYGGFVLAAFGVSLFLLAKYELAENYSPCYDSRAPRALVSSGPYALIRHPIYTANLLIVFGCLVSSGSVWMILNVSVLSLYYGLSARSEERELSLQFPAAGEWLERTGRFLPRPKVIAKGVGRLIKAALRPY